MSGQDIYFIEFGTGIYAGAYPGDSTRVPVSITPGSWSETHARQFYDNGEWWYGGNYYQGTEMWMPMYRAGQKMRDEMHRVVREELSRI